MRRIHPVFAPIRTCNGNEVRGELFFFRHAGVADIEVSPASHAIIFLPDGVCGLCECNIGDRIDTFHSIAPKTVIFSPAKKYLHLRITKTQNEWRLLHFTIDPLFMPLADDYLEQLNGELCTQIGVDDPVIGQALLVALQEIENPSEHRSLYVESLLTLTLIRLLNYQLKHSGRLPHGYVRGGLANWRLKRALQMIEKNSGQMPRLSEIASAVQLHQASFCRAFKQSTGLSPHHYLLVKRVNRAKEMMKNTDRRLTDIALDCGFSSPSQFSVVFKRIVGRCPLRYRRSL